MVSIYTTTGKVGARFPMSNQEMVSPAVKIKTYPEIRETPSFSEDARRALNVVTLIKSTEETEFSEIQKKRIEETQKRIEENAFRVINVVRVVAARISPYIDIAEKNSTPTSFLSNETE